MKLILFFFLLSRITFCQWVPLSFDGGDIDTSDVVHYRIYFSMDSTFGQGVYLIESPGYPWNQIRIFTESPPVEPLTWYYWFVSAEDQAGDITIGEIWCFQTDGFSLDETTPGFFLRRVNTLYYGPLHK